MGCYKLVANNLLHMFRLSMHALLLLQYPDIQYKVHLTLNNKVPSARPRATTLGPCND